MIRRVKPRPKLTGVRDTVSVHGWLGVGVFYPLLVITLTLALMLVLGTRTTFSSYNVSENEMQTIEQETYDYWFI